MTTPRPLGNNALVAITEAAEELNEASTLLEKIIADHTDWPTALLTIAKVIIKIQKALRRLEGQGAQTRP